MKQIIEYKIFNEHLICYPTFREKKKYRDNKIYDILRREK